MCSDCSKCFTLPDIMLATIGDLICSNDKFLYVEDMGLHIDIFLVRYTIYWIYIHLTPDYHITLLLVRSFSLHFYLLNDLSKE